MIHAAAILKDAPWFVWVLYPLFLAAVAVAGFCLVMAAAERTKK